MICHRRLAVPLLLASLLFLVGCNVLGPHTIRAGRAGYNDAVQRTEQEELLLNIVRLRYDDTPMFLELANIVANVEFEASTNGRMNLFSDRLNTHSIDGRIQYRERPSVVYRPIDGDRFARQMLAPIGLNTLLLLDISGWELGQILRVGASSVNGVPNSDKLSNARDSEPGYVRFKRAAMLISQLKERGVLRIGTERTGDDMRLLMVVDHTGSDRTEIEELYDVLGVMKDLDRLEIREAVSTNGQDVAVVTRSLLSVLRFCSQGVEVSPRDIEQGIARGSSSSNGPVEKLFHVRSSTSLAPPGNAFVRVRYRGQWFYIDETDHHTKQTFSVVSMLFALQAKEATGDRGPVLTLPVGG